MPAVASHLVPHHVPPRDPVYGASEAWVADLVTAAIRHVSDAGADAVAAASALTSLEGQVSWEGPAARRFRLRADELSLAGAQSAASLEAALADLRAVRARIWSLTEGIGHGG